jgi:hypothetical protein
MWEVASDGEYGHPASGAGGASSPLKVEWLGRGDLELGRGSSRL